jgi:hypothetical protein
MVCSIRGVRKLRVFLLRGLAIHLQSSLPLIRPRVAAGQAPGMSSTNTGFLSPQTLLASRSLSIVFLIHPRPLSSRSRLRDRTPAKSTAGPPR